MTNARAFLSAGAVGLFTALALLAAPAQAQSVVLPGSSNTEANDSALQLTELEAQLGRLKARAAEWKSKADAFDQEASAAPARLSEIEAEIAVLERGEPLAVDAITGTELDVQLLSAEQNLAIAQREAADLATQQARRPDRRRELPELLAKAKSRLSGLEHATPLNLAEDVVLADLQQQLAEWRSTALREEVRSHELELVSYESRGRLLTARLRHEQLRVAQTEAHIEQLRAAQVAQREGEAERAAEQAMASFAQVESLDPAVQEAVRQLAEQNAHLAQGRTGANGVLESIDAVSRKLSNADQRVNEVEADYQRLSERVQATGLSDSLGLLLRKTRSEMPDVGKYRRFIRMRQQQISEVQEQQIKLREELAALGKIDDLVNGSVERHAQSLSATDRERFADVMRDLLTTKRKHLSALLADYETYFQKLVDFDARQQELIEKTTQLLTYIDQRVLWVPSGGAVHAGAFRDAAGGLRWLSDGTNWGQLLRAVDAVFRETMYLSALGLLAALAALLLLPRRLAPELSELKDAANKATCVDVLPSLKALAIALLLAPWGPAMLGFLGWRLGISADATQFVRCIAGGSIAAAWMWWTLEIPRQLLRRDGLGEAHFAWPVEAVRRLRTSVGWLAALAVPLVFSIEIFELRAEEAWRESLGRFSLITLLIAAALISHRILREGGALHQILRATPSVRSRGGMLRLLHFAAVGVPLGLGFAAARGYFWTARQLGESYYLTLLFLFVLLFAFQFAMRWALLARRRVAFLLAEEKREAARAAQLQRDPGSPAPEHPPTGESAVDLAKVDEQAQRLLATTAVVAMGIGLWFLWVEVVPAFGLLDTVELWTATDTVTIESTAPDGSRVIESEDRIVPFTVANLLVAAILAFMTLVLVRNLPGLLEISLFRHLGTATGERYAYTTIAKYAVTLVGGVLAFNAVGIGWNNIQWLVAAVGLGLGFGLQEIFANFVAGLIILFERPIRVGDTVTVGTISGTVTKIHIRATWITGFDRKELVVPNKEFVTTQLVNWSLTDPILRVEVPVGIAYGSDTERAMRELYAVAEANEDVLTEPRPDVLFLGFGESSLDFELRVYSPDVEHRWIIKHNLNLAIDRAFRDAGIEIAFPQRDLHIRSGLNPPAAAPPSSPEHAPRG